MYIEQLNVLYTLKTLLVTVLLKVLLDCTIVQQKLFDLKLQEFD